MPWFQTFQSLVEKRNNNFFTLLLFGILLCSTNEVFAQELLKINRGELVILRPDGEINSQMLYKNEDGQAQLQQKETTIDADSIKYFKTRNYAEALSNVYINQADSVDIYSNRAKYFGNQRRAELIGEVALMQEVYTLQTDKLNYNFDTKIATYNTGGELSDTTSTLTSKVGQYNLNTKVATFTDSVVLISPNRRIETEKLIYEMDTKWAEFSGPTTIYEEDQVIKTTKGRYNTETGEAKIDGQPTIENEETSFSADLVELDKKGGIGKASGNVNYYDKVNQIRLTSNNAEQLDEDRIKAYNNVHIVSEKDSVDFKGTEAIINDKTEEFFGYNATVKLLNQDTELLADTIQFSEQDGFGLAIGRPFVTSVQEQDSIFMTAKELTAVRQNDTVDSTYNFIANKRFKLFKSDLQAIADSAYVNNVDSLISLFKQPVIWNDSTQMTADSIDIFLKGKDVERVEFRKNAFFINLENNDLYNQLRGKEIIAYFTDGKIDSLFVNSNAETIFYVKDDVDAYVGVDKMKSGQIKVNFEDGKMKEVFWMKQQEGTTIPFEEVNPEDMKFTGFAWRENLRPTSKDYILIAAGRKEGTLPDQSGLDAPKENAASEVMTLGDKEQKELNKKSKPKSNKNEKE